MHRHGFPFALRAGLMALTLSPAMLHAEGAVIHCDDPATVAEWNAKAAKYAGSDDWQRLHALWLGLCQKVREGSIGVNRAIDLFEQERMNTVRKLKRERTMPAEPVG